jgi:hypothetical protein
LIRRGVLNLSDIENHILFELPDKKFLIEKEWPKIIKKKQKAVYPLSFTTSDHWYDSSTTGNSNAAEDEIYFSSSGDESTVKSTTVGEPFTPNILDSKRRSEDFGFGIS